jgi:hypothetical protein
MPTVNSIGKKECDIALPGSTGRRVKKSAVEREGLQRLWIVAGEQDPYSSGAHGDYSYRSFAGIFRQTGKDGICISDGRDCHKSAMRRDTEPDHALQEERPAAQTSGKVEIAPQMEIRTCRYRTLLDPVPRRLCPWKNLHEGLGIPAEVLIQPYDVRGAA